MHAVWSLRETSFNPDRGSGSGEYGFGARVESPIGNARLQILDPGTAFCQFLHDIIFCFQSDSIVLSFSSRTVFLGADVV